MYSQFISTAKTKEKLNKNKFSFVQVGKMLPILGVYKKIFTIFNLQMFNKKFTLKVSMNFF